ncbi:Chromobox 5 [Amphibalanus amphitrite]|uniref:Chromobox 5 n=1 Tax=Amphibalanus amphitrite TaxID=1232801 RepID=A0A6A4VEB4_AMPAM|nr:Chromobox 5 [Amphibalanus amphitrite]
MLAAVKAVLSGDSKALAAKKYRVERKDLIETLRKRAVTPIGVLGSTSPAVDPSSISDVMRKAIGSVILGKMCVKAASTLHRVPFGQLKSLCQSMTARYDSKGAVVVEAASEVPPPQSTSVAASPAQPQAPTSPAPSPAAAEPPPGHIWDNRNGTWILEKDGKQQAFFEVDTILARREAATEGGQPEYLIRWKGYTDAWNTWEPEGNLECTDTLAAFQRRWDTVAEEERRRIIAEFSPVAPAPGLAPAAAAATPAGQQRKGRPPKILPPGKTPPPGKKRGRKPKPKPEPEPEPVPEEVEEPEEVTLDLSSLVDPLAGADLDADVGYFDVNGQFVERSPVKADWSAGGAQFGLDAAAGGDPVPALNNTCLCVPFYNCEDGQLITDGAGLLNPRFGPRDKCTDFNICCNDEQTIKKIEAKPGVDKSVMTTIKDGISELFSGGSKPSVGAGECVCVAFYLCDGGVLSKEIANQVDLRQVCCSNPQVPTGGSGTGAGGIVPDTERPDYDLWKFCKSYPLSVACVRSRQATLSGYDLQNFHRS